MSHATEPPVLDTETTTWISTNVLTRTYLKSCGGVKLIRSCQCEYGKCGHCGAGEHTKCATWIGFNGTPPGSPLTHIVGRKGAALASIWPTGKACRWICSCSTCRESRPVKPEPKAIAYRRATGPLRPEDTVWLTPKTLGCPAICWKRPRATVVATAGVYVTVRIDGTEHRIHQDNLLRSEPGTIAPRKPRPVKPARPMLAGFEEQSLF